MHQFFSAEIILNICRGLFINKQVSTSGYLHIKTFSRCIVQKKEKIVELNGYIPYPAEFWQYHCDPCMQQGGVLCSHHFSVC